MKKLEWNIEWKFVEYLFYPTIFILVVYGVYLSRTNLSFYEGIYTREDGFIEWLTVLALFSSSVMCFYRAYILAPFRNRLFTIVLILMGFVFLFGVGEEISWGQRIFNIKSPHYFIVNNSQHEFNLHNLVLAGVKINKLIFGLLLGIFVALYIMLFPFLYRKYPVIKKWTNLLAIPVPKWSHTAFYIGLFLLTEMIAGGKKGEILEFGGCWIIFLMAFNPLNREIFSRRSFSR